MTAPDFSDLKALLINCTLKPSRAAPKSETTGPNWLSAYSTPTSW